MIDLPDLPNKPKQKWRMVRGIIISGWIMTLVMMLGIIGTCLYLWSASQNVPDPLLALAGVSVAALLKDFGGVIKDFVDDDE